MSSLTELTPSGATGGMECAAQALVPLNIANEHLK
jgi:hypothetical protein